MMTDNRTAAEIIGQFTIQPLPHRCLSIYGWRAAWVAGTGCNASCVFCSSGDLSLHPERLPWAPVTASTWRHQRREMTAEDLVSRAAQHRCQILYYSFTEPTIMLDFIVDAARLAQPLGMATVIDSNGLSSVADIQRAAPFIDACYIGLKGSLRPAFIQRRMRIDPALIETIKTAVVAWRASGVELAINDIVEPPCWQGDDDLATETVGACYSWLAEHVGTDVALDVRPMFRPNTNPPERMLPRNATAADIAAFDRRYQLARDIAAACGLRAGDDYRRLWVA